MRLYYKREIIVTICALALGGSITAYTFGATPLNGVTRAIEYPGANASVDAMSALPPANPGPDLVQAVRRTALATNGDPNLAVDSLRELRTHLGIAGRDSILAFKHPNGAVCVVVWKRAATCPTAGEASLPGVEWLVAGGYPASVAGRQIDLPSAFVAVVDASVHSVALVTDGSPKVLPIINNAVYVELMPPPEGQPWDVRVDVESEDGSHRSIAVPDPRP
jgi:hypothetical protein